MTEQEVRQRYPDAHITPGMRNDGWKVDRYPLMGDIDHLSIPQSLALTDIAQCGRRYRCGQVQLRPVRKLAAYGLVEVNICADRDKAVFVTITPAGRDYADGHFRYGWIPRKKES
jgi:hypothetical protein